MRKVIAWVKGHRAPRRRPRAVSVPMPGQSRPTDRPVAAGRAAGQLDGRAHHLAMVAGGQHQPLLTDDRCSSRPTGVSTITTGRPRDSASSATPELSALPVAYGSTTTSHAPKKTGTWSWATRSRTAAGPACQGQQLGSQGGGVRLPGTTSWALRGSSTAAARAQRSSCTGGSGRKPAASAARRDRATRAPPRRAAAPRTRPDSDHAG